MRGFFFFMYGDEDHPLPWSYAPPPRIFFTGKTTNFVPCRCKYKPGQKTCEHSPMWPRVTTVKGEA